MFTRPTTLLLLSSPTVARIDLDTHRTGVVTGQWMQLVGNEASLAQQLYVALRLGTSKPKNVWILSPDFWTENVFLASDVASALQGDELAQALALEAENASGLSAFETRVAALPISGQRGGIASDGDWLVTQIENSEIEQLRGCVTKAGATLEALAHPSMASHFAQSLTGDTNEDVVTNDAYGSREELERLGNEWCQLLHARHAFKSGQVKAWIDIATAPKRKTPLWVRDAAVMLSACCVCGGLYAYRDHISHQLDQELAAYEAQQTWLKKEEQNTKSLQARVQQLQDEVNRNHEQRNALERKLLVAEQAHRHPNRAWNDCWMLSPAWHVTNAGLKAGRPKMVKLCSVVGPQILPPRIVSLADWKRCYPQRIGSCCRLNRDMPATVP